MDVLDHLTQEHRKAESLIQTMADSEPGAEREHALTELEEALAMHMAVEEKFVYPLVQEHIGAEEEEGAENEPTLTRKGLAQARELVDQEGFGVAVEALKGGLQHRGEQEEQEIFPQLRQKAGAQISALGDPSRLEEIVKAEGMTKAELDDKAREAGIEGRSEMAKDELAEAVAEEEA